MLHKGGMYTTDFSEFTFGYALTRAVEQNMPNVTAVPSFPSLREEGGAGGGYDVKIHSPVAPLFLQFKIPRVMKRHASSSFERDLIGCPHYRMYLHRRNHSNQQLLIDLENQWDQVYYASPEFDAMTAIDQNHRDGTVTDNTFFIRPSAIGPLADDEEHYVAYEAGSTQSIICSDPQKISTLRYADLSRALSPPDNAKPVSDLFEQLIQSFIKIGNQTGLRLQESTDALIGSVSNQRDRAVTASYMARVLFDCQLMIVQAPAAGSL